MRFGRLIVLVLALLLVQQAQCLAACAAETCEQKLPPCHKHHGDAPKDLAARCLHDAVASSVTQLAPADVTPSPIASLPFRFMADHRAPAAIAASPPGAPFSLLRI